MPDNYLRPVNAGWVPRRLSVFYWAFVFLATALVLRLVNLAVVHGQYYTAFSENNFLRERSVGAQRGAIYDRDGRILAYDRATFEVSISRDGITTTAVRTSLENLTRIIGADLTANYEAVVSLKPKWKSHVLRRHLTLDKATPLLEQRYNLAGVAIEPRFGRFYPHGSTLCHVLGYVGKIQRDKWRRLYRPEDGYELDDDVGVTGLEAGFEKLLRGSKGQERIWKTSRGRIIKSQVIESAAQGHTIYLTIDIGLQQLAESLLLGQKGVILAADPRNGEILAWASSPGYDLNRPWDIQEPTSQPLLNRAAREYYRPGSAFKIITATAALDAGWRPERRVDCGGKFFLRGWDKPFECLGHHGSVDLVEAFKYSCNVYFYTMANYLYEQNKQEMGYQLVRTASRFGLGEATGLLAYDKIANAPGLTEKPGRLPTVRDFRAERGSVLHTAIGQGRVDVTPLQLLMAYAALANGGELLVPRLARRIEPSDLEPDDFAATALRHPEAPFALRPEHRQVIIEGLLKAANEPGGTGATAGFDPQWRVAGKTSTAERAAQPDAWFVGFAPAENPEFIILVLIERGGHGGRVAAPLAAKIFDRYFRSVRSPNEIAAR